MNIGFVSIFDENDNKAWSGIVKSMYQNLSLHYPNLISLNGLKVKNNQVIILKKLYNKLVYNKYFEFHRDVPSLKDFGKQIDDFIDKNNLDLIFSPGSFHLAFVKSKVKKIIYIDATFQNLIESSYWYKNYSLEEIDNFNNIEQNIFEKCDKIICATKWAENSLLDFYKIQKEKVSIIPFGANVNQNSNLQLNLNQILKFKNYNQLNLIFIGVDYKRKGLDKVLETVYLINKEYNVNCRLSVIGSNPKIKLKFKDYVTVYGFLDKKDKKQFDIFEKLLLEAHFLFMPSTSEAFGLVYAEASYYGVPSIGHQIDGVQYVIKNGINGYTLPKESTPNDFAVTIIENYEKKNYVNLIESTLKESKNNLNWENSFRQVKQIIDSL